MWLIPFRNYKIQFGYKPGSPIAQKYSVEIHYCDMAQFFV